MKAKFVKTLIVKDPDTKGDVSVYIFKEDSGGMFGVDGSYLDQAFDDGIPVKIPSVFGNGMVTLIGID